MEVFIIADANDELSRLPKSERAAMVNALAKLSTFGDRLPYPHSSQVKTSRFRELRPRGGHSPWRALYRRMGNRVVVLAIVPEALQDPQGFQRGLRVAEERMAELEETP